METEKASLIAIGFSDKESEIYLALLSLGRTTISTLAKETKIARTTITFLIDQMANRGLVGKVKVNGHFEWEPLEPRNLYNEEKRKIGALKDVLPMLEQRKKMLRKTETEIRHYTGVQSVQSIYEKILELGRGDRVYGFEGGRSSEAKRKLLSDDFTARWQSHVRDKGIILEVAVSDALLEVIQNAPLKLLQSIHGRLTITMMIPDAFMDFDSDILVFKNTVAIITPKEKMGIIIEDHAIAYAFKHLLSVTLKMGKKVDLNAFIADEIKKRG